MKCPICDREMIEGGKNLGASLAKVTRLPNAWYCQHCDKVIGIFDAFELN